MSMDMVTDSFFEDEPKSGTVEPKASKASKAEPAKASVPKFTPEQWAEKLGHVRKADPRIPQSVTHYDPAHAAADALYGWSQHAYHFQASPFLLTQEQYVEALARASAFPTCAPLPEALPPGQEKRFEGFRPRAARGND